MSALQMAKPSTLLQAVEKSLVCVAQPNQAAQKSNVVDRQSKHPERRNAKYMVVGRTLRRPLNGSQKPTLSTVNPPKKLKNSTGMTVP
jgi:hypothetical protein